MKNQSISYFADKLNLCIYDSSSQIPIQIISRNSVILLNSCKYWQKVRDKSIKHRYNCIYDRCQRETAEDHPCHQQEKRCHLPLRGPSLLEQREEARRTQAQVHRPPRSGRRCDIQRVLSGKEGSRQGRESACLQDHPDGAEPHPGQGGQGRRHQGGTQGSIRTR